MTNEERLEYLKNKQAMLILKECAYDSYPFNLARETFHSSDRLAHWMSDRVTLDVYKNLLVDAEKYLEKLEGEKKCEGCKTIGNIVVTKKNTCPLHGVEK